MSNLSSVDSQLARAMQEARAKEEASAKRAAATAHNISKEVAKNMAELDSPPLAVTEVKQQQQPVVKDVPAVTEPKSMSHENTDDTNSPVMMPQITIGDGEEARDVVCIFSANCVKCGYLVAHCDNFAFADKAKCHYAEGNPLCPAKYSLIAIAPDFEKASRALATAWGLGGNKPDVKRTTDIMARLMKYDEAISEHVMDLAKKLYTESTRS